MEKKKGPLASLSRICAQRKRYVNVVSVASSQFRSSDLQQSSRRTETPQYHHMETNITHLNQGTRPRAQASSFTSTKDY
ncbi:hypothetical protein KOW79_015653 [Hemibagrus wyckioides]|uniref:Uncharacterized protein n=1 Tax=Hemibagrus wyckioides TaxID=337641 RepID=A0A9D3NH63_9TELE|nr:hypothetical protein KOW79_015653 [Hemibagrus wyckioides]